MFGLAGVAVPGKAAVVADLSATASRSGLPVRRGPPDLRLHGHQITRDDLRRFDPGSGRARQRRAGHHEQGAAAVRMSSSTAVRMDRSQCRKSLKALERMAGIEPAYSAWKAAALPLSYTRAVSDLTWPGAGLNRLPAARCSCSGPRFRVRPRGGRPGMTAKANSLNLGRFGAYIDVSTNNERR
jgi:hypothetical protein